MKGLVQSWMQLLLLCQACCNFYLTTIARSLDSPAIKKKGNVAYQHDADHSNGPRTPCGILVESCRPPQMSCVLHPLAFDKQLHCFLSAGQWAAWHCLRLHLAECSCMGAAVDPLTPKLWTLYPWLCHKFEFTEQHLACNSHPGPCLLAVLPLSFPLFCQSTLQVRCIPLG